MANEFIARNGVIALNNSVITGSLNVTNGITGSLFGTSSFAVSSSFATSASLSSTVITNANLTGNVTSVGNTTTIASGVVTSDMIVNDTIVNADINTSAAIVDTKLATISTGGKVSNSATTATNANTVSAIVARDASGNFSAGTITAALTGNASTSTSASFASTASFANNFTVAGTLTAQTIVAQTITSSTDFITGSTRFGSLLANTHQFTGSVSITGSGNFGGGTLNGAAFIIKGANSTPATSGTTTGAVLRLSSGTGLYNVLDFGTNESLDFSWIQSTRANSLGTYDYLAIQPNGGNLLVGTTANSTFKLDVNGTGRFTGALTGTSATFSAGVNMATSSGNVGIGTTAPNSKLEIFGDDNGGLGNLFLTDNAANAANNGGGIAFGGIFSGTTTTSWAIIHAKKDNNDEGNFAGGLSFSTRTSDAFGERMRITSAGNVGIGTTSTLNKLDVRISSATTYTSTSVGNILTLYNTSATTNSYSGIDLVAEPNSGSAARAAINLIAIGDGIGDLAFSTRNSTMGERMRITSGGNLLLGTTTDIGVKLNVNGTGNFSDALFGTSATFSGVVNGLQGIFKNSGISSIYAYRDLDVTIVGPAGQGIEFGARNGASTFISSAAIFGVLLNPATNGQLEFQTLTASTLTTKLTIASTGAATFSSTITCGSITANSGGRTLTFDNITNYGQNLIINAAGSLPLILQNNGVASLTLASTGAATFSSSVTAEGGLITSYSASSNAFVDINGSTSGVLAGIRLYSAGSTKWIISHSLPSTYRFSIGTATGLTTFSEKFGIDHSTGAATFSSSVTAGGLVTINKQNEGLILTAGSNTDASYMSTRANNSTGWLIMGSQGSVANYIQSGTGANESAITTVGAYALALGTNQTERMRITSGGNVGIGTTTDAGYKLDVNGTGRFTNTLNVFNGNVVVRNDTGSTYRGLSIGATTTDNAEYAFVKYQPNIGDFQFWGSPAAFGGKTSFFNNNIQWLNVSSTNALTFTGAATFSSSVTATQGIFSNISSITSGDQSSARLVIANTGTGGQSVNLIAGNPNVDQTGFSIAYGNTNFLRFASTGAATFSANIVASGTGNIVIQAASSNNFPLFQLLDSRVGGNTWNIEGGRTLANLQFRSSIAGGTVLEIASTGAATFSSSVTAGDGCYINKPHGASIQIASFFTTGMTEGQQSYLSYGKSAASTEGFYQVYNHSTTASSRYLAWQNNQVGPGSQSLVLTAAGNVGIGTASPSAKLHIGESGAAAQLWLQRTDGYNPVKLIGGTLADGSGFKITMNTTDAFAITSGGNVGIGTNAPAYKLDVSGSVRVQSGLVAPLLFNRITTTYTLVLADQGKMIEGNFSTNLVITVPLALSVDFPIGTEISFVKRGTGNVQIVGDSGFSGTVTVNSADSLNIIKKQYGAASLVKADTNEWYLYGNLE